MRRASYFQVLSFLLILSAVSMLFIGTHIIYAEDNLAEILSTGGQMKEGALVFQFPRSDIKMSINGERVPTALGFTSWTAFKAMGESTVVMGDLVLLEKEVNPVISALAQANINVTALHNHFLGDKPRVMYLHLYGSGKDVDLARGIRNALDKTATPRKPRAMPQSVKLKMDTKQIETIIGGPPGQSSAGVFKITLGRPGVKMGDMEITSSMGMNSWAGFAGTDKRAHVAGDIVMTAPEVNQVIRTLRKGNIEVVAVHNHMLDEQPRVFFLHYWGTGTAVKLAETIRDVFGITKNPAR